jgi:ABC-type transport system substrate-binding protein
VHPLFKDPRTRQAVHIALDRDEWTIFRQAGSFEGTQLSYLMPPGSFWAIPQEELITWPGYRQPKDEDIAEANRLMDEVYGVGERPNARCMASNVQNNIDGCLFVMDQLKRHLNMEVTLDSVESAVSTQRQETLNYDMTIGSSLYTEVRDPDDVYPTRFDREFVTANTGLRVDGYEDNSPEVFGRVLSLTKDQSLELDPVKRQAMVWELERTLSSELNAYLILGWTNIFPGWGTNVKGYTSSNHYSQLKWAMWERVWLAD